MSTPEQQQQEADFQEFQAPGTAPVVRSLFDFSRQALGELRSWFEQNPFSVPYNRILGPQNIAVPTGSVVIWPLDAAPPSDWLICDGAAISRATYSALFALLGTVHGAGDGSTTFNLPDLRGRFLVGKAASGTFNTFGAVGGAESGSLVIGTSNLPAHTHEKGSLAVGAGGSHTHGATATPSHSLLGTSGQVIVPGTGGSLLDTSFGGATVAVSVTAATHSHPNSEFTGITGNGGYAGTAIPIATVPPWKVVQWAIKT